MSRKITQEIFVKELKEQHPNLTPLTEYKGSKAEIIVRCNIHNYDFKTNPNNLQQGRECKYCANESRSKSKRKNIDKVKSDFNAVHNNKYVYPLLEEEYKSNKSIITFICPTHGEQHIKALKHLQGHCCQKCNESTLERGIRKLLDEHNINYESQYKGCTTNNKSVDFFLTGYNVAIECQGIQHFKPIAFFGGESNFNKTIKRDIDKFNELMVNDCEVIYVTNKRYLEYITNEIYNKRTYFIEDIKQNASTFLKELIR